VFQLVIIDNAQKWCSAGYRKSGYPLGPLQGPKSAGRELSESKADELVAESGNRYPREDGGRDPNYQLQTVERGR
jgi:hypothetical protein